MEYNPYAPTTTVLSDGPVAADQSGDVELASRCRRLANMLIDTIGATIASVVVAFVLAVADSVLHTHMLASTADVDGLGAWVLYYLVSEALFGRTLGKIMTRTKVVAESGGPAPFWRLLMRTLYRFVPCDPFSFLGKRRPGWHDRWSATRVVLARRIY